jgi:hypothetical protein
MIVTTVLTPPLDSWNFVFSRYEFEPHRYEFFLEVRSEGFAYMNNVLQDLRDHCKEKIHLANTDVFKAAFGQPFCVDRIVSALNKIVACFRFSLYLVS